MGTGSALEPFPFPSKRGRTSKRCVPFFQGSVPSPPMYGRNASGTVIEPSAFW
jgi:hypothetical protein